MAEVELEPYDPAWADRFRRERERIRRRAGGRLLDVFHIGSTAVPDLAAKAAIDVLAVFRDEASMYGATRRLVADGYVHKRNDADWQVLTDPDRGVVLHLRPQWADTWRDQLVFREFLRDSAGARAAYERAKREAATAHPDDVDSYTDAKEETILRLTARAWERGYGEQLPSVA